MFPAVFTFVADFSVVRIGCVAVFKRFSAQDARTCFANFIHILLKMFTGFCSAFWALVVCPRFVNEVFNRFWVGFGSCPLLFSPAMQRSMLGRRNTHKVIIVVVTPIAVNMMNNMP